MVTSLTARLSKIIFQYGSTLSFIDISDFPVEVLRKKETEVLALLNELAELEKVSPSDIQFLTLCK